MGGALLGLTGVSPTPAAATTPIIVLPFSFFDTSGETRDQRLEHSNRLSTMEGDLGTGLQSTGLYRLVPPSRDVATCARSDSECILKTAREAGAAIVLTGAVQKISTMASDIWIGAFDAMSGRRLFYRQLTFRGDTDDAWRHATSFLVHQIEADPPRVP